MRRIQKSHIVGNVPATRGEFMRQAQRACRSYFQPRLGKVAVRLQLLREAPTQSGTSYPHFYLWVEALRAGRILERGAARVDCIERTHVEVTDFLSVQQIRREPKLLEQTFPADLLEGIRAHAAH